MKSTLMIKDLALDKQLDHKSMSAVRGGSNIGGNINAGNYNVADAHSGFGIGNTSTSVVVAPVTQTVTQVDMPTLTNIAGFQFAALR